MKKIKTSLYNKTDIKIPSVLISYLKKLILDTDCNHQELILFPFDEFGSTMQGIKHLYHHQQFSYRLYGFGPINVYITVTKKNDQVDIFVEEAK